MDNMHPTMSVDKDGDTVWRVHNGYHCTDGPAIIWQSGRKDWRVNDKAHRTDGICRWQRKMVLGQRRTVV